MGVTKTAHFNQRQNNIAAMAKAMGHPARVAIIEYLIKTNKCICGDLVNELPLAQATISQHLKELKFAGLIKGEVEGTSICYCIDEKAIAVLRDYFSKIALKLEKKNSCC